MKEDDGHIKIEDLISLAQASKISGLSSVHLRYLVATGNLWGKKIGRNWLTSENALDGYLSRSKRPGRPKKPN